MDENREIAIEVIDIEKKFRVYYDKGSTLKEKLLSRKRNRYEDRSVINGLSFSVKKGEAVGLIGHNGCGKSTTLKMLTRILYPDRGTISMHGRVSSLIELGAGFHPDMSGRENIYTNASIFGLSKTEIDKRLSSIIAFSELGDYIDNPVRTYSSGMYMRLAFSVAINVDADILLIDEILAVGDAAFQAKCFNRLKKIKAEGTTIVIVSHSLGQIEQICDRSIWIDQGKIRLEGTPRDVHPYYLEYMTAKTESNNESLDKQHHTNENPVSTVSAASPIQQDEQNTSPLEQDLPTPSLDRWGDGRVKITKAELTGEKCHEQNSFHTGEAVSLQIHYQSSCDSLEAVCGIGLFTLNHVQVYGTNTQIDHIPNVVLARSGIITCTIPSLTLVPGQYKLDIALHRDDGFAYDYWKNVLEINVYSSVGEVGIAHLNHQWSFS